MNGLPGQAKCHSAAAYLATPCFWIVNSAGVVPASDTGTWAEAAADVEWAHTAAPGANIVFVQAPDQPTAAQMDTAIQTAINKGASVVSMSWVNYAMTTAEAATWDQLPAAFVSGQGDEGYPDTPLPPGDSNVLSVGGTNITAGGEPAWVDSSGGPTGSSVDVNPPNPPVITPTVPVPGYQVGWIPSGSTVRWDNDVALNAAGENSKGTPIGYSVITKVTNNLGVPLPGLHWVHFYGVSAGIPMWAGILAAIDQDRVSYGKTLLEDSGAVSAMYLAAEWPNLTSHKIGPSFFSDVTTGCSYAYKAPSQGAPVPPWLGAL
jgi:hypothetical protein